MDVTATWCHTRCTDTSLAAAALPTFALVGVAAEVQGGLLPKTVRRT